ncbi:MAG: murein hydrolase activator EnvC family protein [Chloroflexota bacterium]
MKDVQPDHVIGPSATGWSYTDGSAARRRKRGRRLGAFVLLIPLMVGLLGGVPASPTAPSIVRGDELSDAKAKQEKLQKDIADQKAQVAKLDALQHDLADGIKQTKDQLSGINADLVTVKAKIVDMEAKIAVIKADYDSLVQQLKTLDAQLVDIEDRETAKRAELSERKALLADRLRSAYDTDRTSLLESFLSGGTFTDLLAEMSYYIDVGEQDKALATQVAQDQETLAQLHETTVDARARTDDLRQETAASKRALDKSLAGLNDAKAALKALEKRVAKALVSQKKEYVQLIKTKAAAKKAIAKASKAQKKLKDEIAALIRKQLQGGNIPSKYNGTLNWPMSGDVTQNFGCTGFAWEPPMGDCAHFHTGIDLVAPYGTAVKASGAGTVVYIGWNYADGADPAWIVIIAHSEGLQTWYAHMQPRYPGGIHAGSHVSRGDVIGYEGDTGHSTGAHLHWAVMFNGDFVNPRLFL